MGTIFYTTPTSFGLLSYHLQGADTKISVKHTTIKEVRIDIHTYIRCRISSAGFYRFWLKLRT